MVPSKGRFDRVFEALKIEQEGPELCLIEKKKTPILLVPIPILVVSDQNLINCAWVSLSYHVQICYTELFDSILPSSPQNIEIIPFGGKKTVPSSMYTTFGWACHGNLFPHLV